MFWEECKYIIKDKKDAWSYHWKHRIPFDDSKREDYGKDNSNEKMFSEENLNEES